MKFLITLVFSSSLLVASFAEKLAEKSDVFEGKVEKKAIKRGLYSLGYGSETLNYGTLGGYGLGSTISHPRYHTYPSYGYAGLSTLNGYSNYGIYASFPTSIHTTITKHVPVPVPHAVPVTVEKHIPVSVAAPYPVEVLRPYPVEVPKPIAIPVHQPYAVPVDRPYPVAVPHPVPVPVYKHVGVPIPQPVATPLATQHLSLPIYSKEVYSHDW